MKSIGQKFKSVIPPTVLQKEAKLDSLQAEDKIKKEAKKRRILTEIKQVQEGKGLTGMTKGENDEAGLEKQDQQFLMLNALYLELNQLLNTEEDAGIDQAFIEGFVNWIQGKISDNEIEERKKLIEDRTPWWWYNNKTGLRGVNPSIKPRQKPADWEVKPVKLAGDEFIYYIRNMIRKKHDFWQKMTVLKTFIPSDLHTAWLYWKYIINGTNVLESDYLSVIPDMFTPGENGPNVPGPYPIRGLQVPHVPGPPPTPPYTGQPQAPPSGVPQAVQVAPPTLNQVKQQVLAGPRDPNAPEPMDIDDTQQVFTIPEKDSEPLMAPQSVVDQLGALIVKLTGEVGTLEQQQQRERLQHSKEIQEKANEALQLKKDLENLRQGKIAAEGRIKKGQENEKQLNAELNQRKAEVTKLAKANSQAQARLKQLEAELQNYIDNPTPDTSALVADLENQVNAAQHEAKRNENLLQVAQQQQTQAIGVLTSTLESERKKFGKKESDLISQIEEMERKRQREELGHIQTKASLSLRESELATSKKLASRLEQELENLRKNPTNTDTIEALQNTISQSALDYQAQLGTHALEKATLEEEMKKAERKHHKGIKGLNKQLSAAKTESTRLKTELETRNLSVTSLDTRIKTLESELETRVKDYNALGEKHKNQTKEASETKKAKESVEKKLKDLEMHEWKLSDDLKNAMETIEKLKGKVTKAKERVTQAVAANLPTSATEGAPEGYQFGPQEPEEATYDEAEWKSLIAIAKTEIERSEVAARYLGRISELTELQDKLSEEKKKINSFLATASAHQFDVLSNKKLTISRLKNKLSEHVSNFAVERKQEHRDVTQAELTKILKDIEVTEKEGKVPAKAFRNQVKKERELLFALQKEHEDRVEQLGREITKHEKKIEQQSKELTRKEGKKITQIEKDKLLKEIESLKKSSEADKTKHEKEIKKKTQQLKNLEANFIAIQSKHDEAMENIRRDTAKLGLAASLSSGSSSSSTEVAVPYVEGGEAMTDEPPTAAEGAPFVAGGNFAAEGAPFMPGASFAAESHPAQLDDTYNMLQEVYQTTNEVDFFVEGQPAFSAEGVNAYLSNGALGTEVEMGMQRVENQMIREGEEESAVMQKVTDRVDFKSMFKGARNLNVDLDSETIRKANELRKQGNDEGAIQILNQMALNVSYSLHEQSGRASQAISRFIANTDARTYNNFGATLQKAKEQEGFDYEINSNDPYQEKERMKAKWQELIYNWQKNHPQAMEAVNLDVYEMHFNSLLYFNLYYPNDLPLGILTYYKTGFPQLADDSLKFLIGELAKGKLSMYSLNDWAIGKINDKDIVDLLNKPSQIFPAWTQRSKKGEKRYFG